jgi:hypothetical protein
MNSVPENIDRAPVEAAVAVGDVDSAPFLPTSLFEVQGAARLTCASCSTCLEALGSCWHKIPDCSYIRS